MKKTMESEYLRERSSVKEKENGAVTFILPNYNHAEFLDESIGGILRQVRSKDKVIIIDDGSTDHSWEKIQSLVPNSNNISLIKHKQNKGCVQTLNEGLSLARTEFVCFAAADDRLENNYLRKCLPLIQAYPEAAFCSGAGYIINSKSKIIGIRPLFFPAYSSSFISPQNVKRLLRKSDNFFLGQTTLFRRRFLLKMNGFNLELKYFTDGMVMRHLALTYGFCFIPAPLASWRFLETNQSVKNIIDKDYLDALVKSSRTYIAQQPNGVFPKNYGNLLERRLRFGSARLKILTTPSFTKEQILVLSQLLKLLRTRKAVLLLLSHFNSNKLLILFSFLVTLPFNIFYLLETFLKKYRFCRKNF